MAIEAVAKPTKGRYKVKRKYLTNTQIRKLKKLYDDNPDITYKELSRATGYGTPNAISTMFRIRLGIYKIGPKAHPNTSFETAIKDFTQPISPGTHNKPLDDMPFLNSINPVDELLESIQANNTITGRIIERLHLYDGLKKAFSVLNDDHNTLKNEHHQLEDKHRVVVKKYDELLSSTSKMRSQYIELQELLSRPN